MSEKKLLVVRNAVTIGVILGLGILLCVFVWVTTPRDRNSGELLEVENVAGTDSVEPADGLVPTEDDDAKAEDFLEVNDTVTAKDLTNLRSEPTMGDNIVSQLLNGETLTRTGVNESTGWSCLEWNGQTVYAVSEYLTTDLDYKPVVGPTNRNFFLTADHNVVVFRDCDDVVTPKEYVNLRTEPSTSQGDTTVRAHLEAGEQVHRTGYSPDSGWSRVEHNGEVLYVVSSYVVLVEETGTSKQ
ncbi:MAG: hypothetical protein J1E64_03525 [Acetatifactor sp.]|nr:hypothetical protein [Acetatifactor sp.]